MRITHEVREFVDEPVDACLVSTTWAVWCHSPTLCGSLNWGAPLRADLESFAKVLHFVRRPDFTSVDVLLDLRRLEHLASDALMAFRVRVTSGLAEWSRHIHKMAVIMPSGLTSVLVAGVLVSVQPPFPFLFVADPRDALDFLARPEAPAILEQVGSLIDKDRGPALVIDRLRAHVTLELTRPSVGAAAKALGISARSLQRDLQSMKTSFSAEVRRARVGAALELLRSTDARVEAIAQRVGFSSPSRMSLAFRAEVGLTPSQVRANRTA